MIQTDNNASETLTKQFLVNFHKCEFCPYRTKHTSNINDHFGYHETRTARDFFYCYKKLEETQQCPHCDLRSPMQSLLIGHVKIKHRELNAKPIFPKQYKCKWCDFETFSQIVLTEHTSRHLAPPVFVNCPTVKNETFFHNESGYEKNESNPPWMSYNIIFECSYCEFFKMNHKSVLKSHLLTKHISGPRSNCVEYKYDFYSIQSDFLVIRMDFEFKPSTGQNLDYFECERCCYRTPSWSIMKRHFLVTQNHPRFCEFVDQALTFKSYKCGECDSYTSKTMDDVAKHILEKHSDNVV